MTLKLLVARCCLNLSYVNSQYFIFRFFPSSVIGVIVFVLFVATESLGKFSFMVSVWICQQIMFIIHITFINVKKPDSVSLEVN